MYIYIHSDVLVHILIYIYIYMCECMRLEFESKVSQIKIIYLRVGNACARSFLAQSFDFGAKFKCTRTICDPRRKRRRWPLREACYFWDFNNILYALVPHQFQRHPPPPPLKTQMRRTVKSSGSYAEKGEIPAGTRGGKQKMCSWFIVRQILWFRTLKYTCIVYDCFVCVCIWSKTPVATAEISVLDFGRHPSRNTDTNIWWPYHWAAGPDNVIAFCVFLLLLLLLFIYHASKIRKI